MSLLKKKEKALSDDRYPDTDKKRTEAYLHTRKRASMTLEAVVVLPLFTGFLIFLLFYFRMMQVQTGMEQAMAYTARIAAASVKESTDGVNPAKIRLLLLHRIRKEEVPYEYIDRGLAGISLQYSNFEGEEILIHVSYRMTVPAAFFGKLTYPLEQEVSARKWTGRVSRAEEEEEEAYVYVTKRGKVYHKSRECPYLDLSIRTVSADSLKRLRNKDGGKYRSCGSCKKSGNGRKQCYYVTDYGDCYHRDISCGGLKRIVYVISIRQVGDRRGCSKCTGG